ALLVISATIPAGSLRTLAEPAQATTGTVQGQVTDSSGAAVVGAGVTISNSITNYKVSAKTDETGGFKFKNVTFNFYKLTVVAPEFQQNEQTIDMHSAVPLQVNVQLAVKALAAEVSVSADDSHVIEPDRTSADTDLNTPMLMKQLGAAPSRGLQKM